MSSKASKIKPQRQKKRKLSDDAAPSRTAVSPATKVATTLTSVDQDAKELAKAVMAVIASLNQDNDKLTFIADFGKHLNELALDARVGKQCDACQELIESSDEEEEEDEEDDNSVCEERTSSSYVCGECRSTICPNCYEGNCYNCQTPVCCDCVYSGRNAHVVCHDQCC